MDEREGSGAKELRDAAVRAELNRLLDSAPFRNSKRCSEFLKYIVEQTLSGASGTLKERSIGVELFQLPPDFDTGQHAIVRVTANEVRKRLAQQYLADGSSIHQVRIDLPPGSYSAEFRWEPPAPQVQAPAPARWPARPIIASAAMLLVIVGTYFVWRWRTAQPLSPQTAEPAPAAGSASGTAPVGEDWRMIAGSSAPYTDRNGRRWVADQFFSGGRTLVRPSERILRTLDPDIYRHLRMGEFRYDIPLRPGSYELRLHFAETGLADSMSAESSGEGQRLFRVSVNGETKLDAFDVVADAAGANIASERVFRNISPAEDGFLHLTFSSMRGSAFLNGIEVLPVVQDKVRPTRIRAGWPTSWRDSAGQQWLADSYFLGGNALVRTANPVREDYSTQSDAALYASERWGHFSYAIPVAEGRYRVTLRFAEGHYGKQNTGVGGLGSRVFDVYCNGVALLRDFDIIKEAGGEGRPVERGFSGIRPTAQGKIVLTFVPVKGMACVNGIEVVEE
ncbi:MAG: malectin domain-containing carbohydrate-binding protein [Bryobacteraceae bacterium]